MPLPKGLADWMKNNPQKAAANRAKFQAKSKAPAAQPNSTAAKVASSTRHERGRNKTGASRNGRNTTATLQGSGRNVTYKIGH